MLLTHQFILLLFLSEDTSEINLNMLLAFWTGAETIPPLGFHKKLEIKFVEDPALLPVAHTCDLLLEISRGETPEEFHRKMELAITCGEEFLLLKKRNFI